MEMFMSSCSELCSRDLWEQSQRTTVRMFQFENHAFYVHEKHYVDGFKFMDIKTEDCGKTYYITWDDLVSVLETPVVKTLKLEQSAKATYKRKH